MINSGREREIEVRCGSILNSGREREIEVRCGSILNSGRERERLKLDVDQ